MVILLDAGPLGLATNPNTRNDSAARDCALWLQRLFRAGATICVPEIADYEVRRGLLEDSLRRGFVVNGIERLNELGSHSEYLRISTEVMQKAADLWAEAHFRGIPTADRKSLDADMILSAQAQLRAGNGDSVVVATTNVRHLDRFVDAKEWSEITMT